MQFHYGVKSTFKLFPVQILTRCTTATLNDFTRDDFSQTHNETIYTHMILCHFGLWVNHWYVLHFHCATLLLPPLHSSIFPSTSIAHFHCNYSSFAKFNYIFCMHMFFNLVANFNNVFCINIIIPYILTVHFQYGLFPIQCVLTLCVYVLYPSCTQPPCSATTKNKFRCR